MQINIQDRTIETSEQGYLMEKGDWDEDFASEMARRDGVTLYTDHWELIWYFRDYFEENQRNPTMHSMIRSLGRSKGSHFHDQKVYEKHIYSLFPTDPIHELCKLAGLSMPPPDT